MPEERKIIKGNADEHGFSVIWLLIIVLLVAIVAVSGWIVYKDRSGYSKNGTVSQTTYSTRSQGSANQARTEDASAILSAVNEFIDGNSGTFPKKISLGKNPNGLLVCSNSCSQGYYKSLTLSYFLPKNVMLHSYYANLIVPNDETVYIVNGASCANTTQLGKEVSDPVDVVLFALQNGTSIDQQCLGG